jgi:hypothetical protein
VPERKQESIDRELKAFSHCKNLYLCLFEKVVLYFVRFFSTICEACNYSDY